MTIGLTYDRKSRRAATRRPPRVDYPNGDGKPMAETGAHVDLIVYHIGALQSFYSNSEPPVFVAGNNFLYYEEGNPNARISPDTYVVPGVSARLRDSYKVWEEGGRAPCVVFEFTSRGTKDEDTKRKFKLYEQVLKVPEYFLFDPRAEYISQRLRGFRLQNGEYVAILLEDGRMSSEQLGLELVVEGARLRLYDPVAGRFLRNVTEAEVRIAAIEEQVIAEAIGRERAEANAAAEAAARAEADARRADSEAENARLRAELAAIREKEQRGG